MDLFNPFHVTPQQLPPPPYPGVSSQLQGHELYQGQQSDLSGSLSYGQQHTSPGYSQHGLSTDFLGQSSSTPLSPEFGHSGLFGQGQRSLESLPLNQDIPPMLGAMQRLANLTAGTNYIDPPSSLGGMGAMGSLDAMQQPQLNLLAGMAGTLGNEYGTLAASSHNSYGYQHQGENYVAQNREINRRMSWGERSQMGQGADGFLTPMGSSLSPGHSQGHTGVRQSVHTSPRAQVYPSPNSRTPPSGRAFQYPSPHTSPSGRHFVSSSSRTPPNSQGPPNISLLPPGGNQRTYDRSSPRVPNLTYQPRFPHMSTVRPGLPDSMVRPAGGQRFTPGSYNQLVPNSPSRGQRNPNLLMTNNPQVAAGVGGPSQLPPGNRHASSQQQQSPHKSPPAQARAPRVRQKDYGVIVLDEEEAANSPNALRNRAGIRAGGAALNRRFSSQPEFITIDELMPNSSEQNHYCPPPEDVCIVIEPKPDFVEEEAAAPDSTINQRSSNQSTEARTVCSPDSSTERENIRSEVEALVSSLLNKHRQPGEASATRDSTSMPTSFRTRDDIHQLVSSLLDKHKRPGDKRPGDADTTNSSRDKSMPTSNLPTQQQENSSSSRSSSVRRDSSTPGVVHSTQGNASSSSRTPPYTNRTPPRTNRTPPNQHRLSPTSHRNSVEAHDRLLASGQITPTVIAPHEPLPSSQNQSESRITPNTPISVSSTSRSTPNTTNNSQSNLNDHSSSNEITNFVNNLLQKHGPQPGLDAARSKGVQSASISSAAGTVAPNHAGNQQPASEQTLNTTSVRTFVEESNSLAMTASSDCGQKNVNSHMPDTAVSSTLTSAVDHGNLSQSTKASQHIEDVGGLVSNLLNKYQLSGKVSGVPEPSAPVNPSEASIPSSSVGETTSTVGSSSSQTISSMLSTVADSASSNQQTVNVVRLVSNITGSRSSQPPDVSNTPLQTSGGAAGGHTIDSSTSTRNQTSSRHPSVIGSTNRQSLSTNPSQTVAPVEHTQVPTSQPSVNPPFDSSQVVVHNIVPETVANDDVLRPSKSSSSSGYHGSSTDGSTAAVPHVITPVSQSIASSQSSHGHMSFSENSVTFDKNDPRPARGFTNELNTSTPSSNHRQLPLSSSNVASESRLVNMHSVGEQNSGTQPSSRQQPSLPVDHVASANSTIRQRCWSDSDAAASLNHSHLPSEKHLSVGAGRRVSTSVLSQEHAHGDFRISQRLSSLAPAPSSDSRGQHSAISGIPHSYTDSPQVAYPAQRGQRSQSYSHDMLPSSSSQLSLSTNSSSRNPAVNSSGQHRHGNSHSSSMPTSQAHCHIPKHHGSNHSTNQRNSFHMSTSHYGDESVGLRTQSRSMSLSSYPPGNVFHDRSLGFQGDLLNERDIYGASQSMVDMALPSLPPRQQSSHQPNVSHSQMRTSQAYSDFRLSNLGSGLGSASSQSHTSTPLPSISSMMSPLHSTSLPSALRPQSQSLPAAADVLTASHPTSSLGMQSATNSLLSPSSSLTLTSPYGSSAASAASSQLPLSSSLVTTVTPVPIAASAVPFSPTASTVTTTISSAFQPRATQSPKGSLCRTSQWGQPTYCEESPRSDYNSNRLTDFAVPFPPHTSPVAHYRHSAQQSPVAAVMPSSVSVPHDVSRDFGELDMSEVISSITKLASGIGLDLMDAALSQMYGSDPLTATALTSPYDALNSYAHISPPAMSLMSPPGNAYHVPGNSMSWGASYPPSPVHLHTPECARQVHVSPRARCTPGLSKSPIHHRTPPHMMSACDTVSPNRSWTCFPLPKSPIHHALSPRRGSQGMYLEHTSRRAVHSRTPPSAGWGGYDHSPLSPRAPQTPGAGHPLLNSSAEYLSDPGWGAYVPAVSPPVNHTSTLHASAVTPSHLSGDSTWENYPSYHQPSMCPTPQHPVQLNQSLLSDMDTSAQIQRNLGADPAALSLDTGQSYPTQGLPPVASIMDKSLPIPSTISSMPLTDTLTDSVPSKSPTEPHIFDTISSLLSSDMLDNDSQDMLEMDTSVKVSGYTFNLNDPQLETIDPNFSAMLGLSNDFPPYPDRLGEPSQIGSLSQQTVNDIQLQIMKNVARRLLEYYRIRGYRWDPLFVQASPPPMSKLQPVVTLSRLSPSILAQHLHTPLFGKKKTCLIKGLKQRSKRMPNVKNKLTSVKSSKTGAKTGKQRGRAKGKGKGKASQKNVSKLCGKASLKSVSSSKSVKSVRSHEPLILRLSLPSAKPKLCRDPRIPLEVRIRLEKIDMGGAESVSAHWMIRKLGLPGYMSPLDGSMPLSQPPSVASSSSTIIGSAISDPVWDPENCETFLSSLPRHLLSCSDTTDSEVSSSVNTSALPVEGSPKRYQLHYEDSTKLVKKFKIIPEDSSDRHHRKHRKRRRFSIVEDASSGDECHSPVKQPLDPAPSFRQYEIAEGQNALKRKFRLISDSSKDQVPVKRKLYMSEAQRSINKAKKAAEEEKAKREKLERLRAAARVYDFTEDDSDVLEPKRIKLCDKGRFSEAADSVTRDESRPVRNGGPAVNSIRSEKNVHSVHHGARNSESDTKDVVERTAHRERSIEVKNSNTGTLLIRYSQHGTTRSKKAEKSKHAGRRNHQVVGGGYDFTEHSRGSTPPHRNSCDRKKTSEVAGSGSPAWTVVSKMPERSASTERNIKQVDNPKHLRDDLGNSHDQDRGVAIERTREKRDGDHPNTNEQLVRDNPRDLQSDGLTCPGPGDKIATHENRQKDGATKKRIKMTLPIPVNLPMLDASGDDVSPNVSETREKGPAASLRDTFTPDASEQARSLMSSSEDDLVSSEGTANNTGDISDPGLHSGGRSDAGTNNSAMQESAGREISQIKIAFRPADAGRNAVLTQEIPNCESGDESNVDRDSSIDRCTRSRSGSAAAAGGISDVPSDIPSDLPQTADGQSENVSTTSDLASGGSDHATSQDQMNVNRSENQTSALEPSTGAVSGDFDPAESPPKVTNQARTSDPQCNDFDVDQTLQNRSESAVDVSDIPLRDFTNDNSSLRKTPCNTLENSTDTSQAPSTIAVAKNDSVAVVSDTVTSVDPSDPVCCDPNQKKVSNESVDEIPRENISDAVGDGDFRESESDASDFTSGVFQTAHASPVPHVAEVGGNDSSAVGNREAQASENAPQSVGPQPYTSCLQHDNQLSTSYPVQKCDAAVSLTSRSHQFLDAFVDSDLSSAFELLDSCQLQPEEPNRDLPEKVVLDSHSTPDSTKCLPSQRCDDGPTSVVGVSDKEVLELKTHPDSDTAGHPNLPKSHLGNVGGESERAMMMSQVDISGGAHAGKLDGLDQLNDSSAVEGRSSPCLSQISHHVSGVESGINTEKSKSCMVQTVFDLLSAPTEASGEIESAADGDQDLKGSGTRLDSDDSNSHEKHVMPHASSDGLEITDTPAGNQHDKVSADAEDPSALSTGSTTGERKQDELPTGPQTATKHDAANTDHALQDANPESLHPHPVEEGPVNPCTEGNKTDPSVADNNLTKRDPCTEVLKSESTEVVSSAAVGMEGVSSESVCDESHRSSPTSHGIEEQVPEKSPISDEDKELNAGTLVLDQNGLPRSEEWRANNQPMQSETEGKGACVSDKGESSPEMASMPAAMDKDESIAGHATPVDGEHHGAAFSDITEEKELSSDPSDLVAAAKEACDVKATASCATTEREPRDTETAPDVVEEELKLDTSQVVMAKNDLDLKLADITNNESECSAEAIVPSTKDGPCTKVIHDASENGHGDKSIPMVCDEGTAPPSGHDVEEQSITEATDPVCRTSDERDSIEVRSGHDLPDGGVLDVMNHLLSEVESVMRPAREEMPEPGISCVETTFCTTSVVQNVLPTQELPSSVHHSSAEQMKGVDMNDVSDCDSDKCLQIWSKDSELPCSSDAPSSLLTSSDICRQDVQADPSPDDHKTHVDDACLSSGDGEQRTVCSEEKSSGNDDTIEDLSSDGLVSKSIHQSVSASCLDSDPKHLTPISGHLELGTQALEDSVSDLQQKPSSTDKENDGILESSQKEGMLVEEDDPETLKSSSSPLLVSDSHGPMAGTPELQEKIQRQASSEVASASYGESPGSSQSALNEACQQADEQTISKPLASTVVVEAQEGCNAEVADVPPLKEAIVESQVKTAPSDKPLNSGLQHSLTDPQEEKAHSEHTVSGSVLENSDTSLTHSSSRRIGFKRKRESDVVLSSERPAKYAAIESSTGSAAPGNPVTGHSDHGYCLPKGLLGQQFRDTDFTVASRQDRSKLPRPEEHHSNLVKSVMFKLGVAEQMFVEPEVYSESMVMDSVPLRESGDSEGSAEQLHVEVEGLVHVDAETVSIPQAEHGISCVETIFRPTDVGRNVVSTQEIPSPAQGLMLADSSCISPPSKSASPAHSERKLSTQSDDEDTTSVDEHTDGNASSPGHVDTNPPHICLICLKKFENWKLVRKHAYAEHITATEITPKSSEISTNRPEPSESNGLESAPHSAAVTSAENSVYGGNDPKCSADINSGSHEKAAADSECDAGPVHSLSSDEWVLTTDHLSNSTHSRSAPSDVGIEHEEGSCPTRSAECTLLDKAETQTTLQAKCSTQPVSNISHQDGSKNSISPICQEKPHQISDRDADCDVNEAVVRNTGQSSMDEQRSSVRPGVKVPPSQAHVNSSAGACDEQQVSVDMSDGSQHHRSVVASPTSQISPHLPPATGELTTVQKSSKISKTLNEWPCPQCDRVFSKGHLLRTHKDLHHSEKKSTFGCEICEGVVFATLKAAKYHVLNKHLTKSKSHSCVRCNKVYNTKSCLRSHMRAVHEVGTQYACKVCDFKTPNRSEHRSHLKNAHDLLKKTCEICGKVLSGGATYNKHMRMHKQKKVYKCSQCPKSFIQKFTLQLHEFTHSGVKPFPCPVCEKPYSQPYTLQQHLKKHHPGVKHTVVHSVKKLTDLKKRPAESDPNPDASKKPREESTDHKTEFTDPQPGPSNTPENLIDTS